jgi:CHAT domain-containing protein
VAANPLKDCLVALFFVCLAATSGGCRKASTPDATFQQIREEMRKGQLEAALQHVDAALSRYQSKDAQSAARFRVQKAHILMMRGSYSESLLLLKEPLPPALSRSDTEVQKKMVEGLNYDYLQQLDAADRALSQAEALAAEINSSIRGSVAQARGILEVDRKNYDRAAAEFRTAASIARAQNLPAAELNALGNLGNVAMWQEHYDEAVDRFRTALDRSRAMGSLGQESKSLGNLGWGYTILGDFENAEVSFSDAQTKAAQAGLVEDQTYWLTALGEAYFHQARYQDADATARKALGLARGHDDKRTLVNCLNTLSEVALAIDNVPEAAKFNDEALQIENAGLDKSNLDFTRLIAGRVQAMRQDYKGAEALFQSVAGNSNAQTQHKWEALGWLAVIYADQNQSAKADQQFRMVLKTIQDAQRSLPREEFRVSFLSGAIVFYEAYVNFLVKERRPLDALKIADFSRSQTLELRLAQEADTKSGRAAAFDAQVIARRTNATLLFYWLGQARWFGRQLSYLWVVTPSKISVFSLNSTAEIDAAVKSYRESFTGPRDPLEAGNPDGKKLYEWLVRPAEKFIPQNSRVIVLPDGSLNSLNFETLIDSRPQPHYWIEDVTVSTATSLSLLARNSASMIPNNGKLLLVGNTVSASRDFPALPQTAKEISLLEKYFPPSDRLELAGQNATPSAVLSSRPEQFSYLHFATHGTSSRLRPLESAVILSPQADSGFKLYARDILQHPLNAYLVTISACNGAGTKTYAGEGLVGLSWAFLRAGAHNVIAGLWEVSEVSTPELMDELYKGLKSGQDPATALRNAKLTLVHSTAIYRKPFYWAPFLLYSGS